MTEQEMKVGDTKLEKPEQAYAYTYIWPDAEGQVRGKVKILRASEPLKIEDFPKWRFDGGSTGQGTVKESDCIIVPRHLFNDIVVCDVYDSEGSPHKTNYREHLVRLEEKDQHAIQFGVEQEFTITQLFGQPIVQNVEELDPRTMERTKGKCARGFELTGNPFEATRFVGTRSGYCMGDNPGLDLVKEHMKSCLQYDLPYGGYNAEVTRHQWEYQLGPAEGSIMADAILVSRWLLQQIAELMGHAVTFHPKPFDDLNGAGCHINISTLQSRSKKLDNPSPRLRALAQKFEKYHEEHMLAYGNNSLRMTGDHETSDPTVFSVGVGTRNTSIRVPDGLSGQCYIEDRRPASNVDPYRAFARIIETINYE